MNSSEHSSHQPLVSVVIPTYNRADTIAETLNSVIAQTYQNLEILIVDDGSTDNTAEVIAPFLADPRVKFIGQKNLERSATRNHGILESSGEYLAFLDSDDMWYPRKIEMQTAFMETHPEVGMCSCRTALINDEMKSPMPPMDDFSEVKIGRMLAELVCYKVNFLSPSWLIRRQCFYEVGLYENLPWIIKHEDFDLNLRLAGRFPVAYLPDVMCAYRMPPGERSFRPERSYPARLRLLKRLLKYQHVPPLTRQERWLIGSTMMHRCASSSWHEFLKGRIWASIRLVCSCARYAIFSILI